MHVLVMHVLIMHILIMMKVLIVLMILILTGEEGQMALRTLVGVVSLSTALEAGDLFQGLVDNSLQSLGGNRVVIIVIGWFDIAEGAVSRFFLSLSCFSLL